MTFDEWLKAHGVPLAPGVGYSLEDASRRAWDAARAQALQDAAQRAEEFITRGRSPMGQPVAEAIRALK